MSKLSVAILFATGAVFAVPSVTSAQQNVPPAVRQAEAEVESAVSRFGVGVQGGTGLDPEIINFGAHATFGPIFRPTLQFRPGIEFGIGEVTTMFAINMDFLYTLPGFTGETRWMPYVGVGPNFGLSNRSFETDEVDLVDIDGAPDVERGRFDFSDTDFNGGMNFIVGMRRPSGAFFEMRATAWGVSNIRLVAGFNF